MTALERLHTVRGLLVTGIAIRAVAWGIAASASLVVGAVLFDLAVPLSLAVRQALVALTAAAGVVVAASIWWRDRGVLSIGRVALWVEERHPSLEYRLVTAIETGDTRTLNDLVHVGWSATARGRLVRAMARPTVAVAAALIVIVGLPGGVVARIRSPHAGDSLERRGFGAHEGTSRLTPLVSSVVPPRYSGLRPVTLDEPSDIRALIGSDVTLAGRGAGQGIEAVVGRDSVAAQTHGNQWSLTVHVGDKPVAVRLADRTYHRIVAIEPIVDLPPVVTLRSPAHDSILRAPAGRLELTADVSDDFGITTSSFEYIVSSGEGETFKFRSGVVGAVRPNARTASLAAALPIDALGLEPGDVVHVRAVASDGNSVTGPGIGRSETRSLRIARSGEYDSVAVDAAAPSDEEKSVISERMLIMLAEALERKRPSIARGTLVGESRAIAADQRQLRRTVGEMVFTRLGGDPTGEEHSGDDTPARAKTMAEMLVRADSATNRSTDPIDFEGGESPVVAVNEPLLEAYNAMWDATMQLEGADPADALPHMRRALGAIQKARQAERVYLHGGAAPVVVDVDNARLKGKDKGSASLRFALSSTDSATQDRVARFARAVELTRGNPTAAVDSLVLLRIDALSDAPAFAAALGDAVEALRRRHESDAVLALARARRVLAGAPVARDSLSRWGIVP